MATPVPYENSWRQAWHGGGRGGEGVGEGVELVTVTTQLKVLVKTFSRARFTVQRIQISKVILRNVLTDIIM